MIQGEFNNTITVAVGAWVVAAISLGMFEKGMPQHSH